MQLTHEQIGWFITAAAWWAQQIPVVKALVLLIGIDIASGWLLAISKHTLNSTTSFQGMCKKVAIMLFVVVGIVIEPFANGLPLSVIFATGFLIQELLSIVENMAALGIKFPSAVLEVLEKFQDSKKCKLDQKARGASVLERNTVAQDENTAALQSLAVSRQDNTAAIRGLTHFHESAPLPVVVVNPPDHPVHNHPV